MTDKIKPTQDKDNDPTTLSEQPSIQPIVDLGSTTIRNSRGTIHCLTIVGQIEGHMVLPNTTKATKYEHVMPLLAALEETEEIDGVLFLLNTVGGDVEAGLAIAELISGMTKPTVSLVLGGGHSIGVPLAVSCERSFIVPSATMTVHPVRMNGTLLGVPQTLSYFEKMQDRIVNFVESNSNISADDFRRLMMKTGELVMERAAWEIIPAFLAYSTESLRFLWSFNPQKEREISVP